MTPCLFFAVFFGLWSVVITVLYFMADTKYHDQLGWVIRTQNEIDYIRRRHPKLWTLISNAMAQRHLDENHNDA